MSQETRILLPFITYHHMSGGGCISWNPNAKRTGKQNKVIFVMMKKAKTFKDNLGSFVFRYPGSENATKDWEPGVFRTMWKTRENSLSPNLARENPDYRLTV
jgi:hypothetical protein